MLYVVICFITLVITQMESCSTVLATCIIKYYIPILGPQAAPTFDRSDVTGGSISITWNPIPCGSRRGNITGYRAELYLAKETQLQQFVGTRTTSAQFEGLSPCTLYTVVVSTLGASEGTSFEREETTHTIGMRTSNFRNI